MILGFLKQRWIFLLSFHWKFVEMFWNSMEDVDDINGTSKYFREYLIYDLGFFKRSFYRSEIEQDVDNVKWVIKVF